MDTVCDSVLDAVDDLVGKADRALTQLRLLKSPPYEGQPEYLISPSTRLQTVAAWDNTPPYSRISAEKFEGALTTGESLGYQTTIRKVKPTSVLRKSALQRERHLHPPSQAIHPRLELDPSATPPPPQEPPAAMRNAYRVLDEKFNPKDDASAKKLGFQTVDFDARSTVLVSKPLPPTPYPPTQKPRSRESNPAKLTRPPRLPDGSQNVPPRIMCSMTTERPMPRRAETAPSSWTRISGRKITTSSNLTPTARVRFSAPPASPAASLPESRATRARLTKPLSKEVKEPTIGTQNALHKSKSDTLEKYERWIPPEPSKALTPTPKQASRRYSLIEVSKSPPVTIVQLPRSATPPGTRIPRTKTSNASAIENRATRIANSPGFRGVSLRADEIRPDLEKCDVLVIAIAEMEICKEIFAGWKSQLDVAGTDPRRSDKLEASIIASVEKLNLGASAALQSSRAILQLYQSITRAMEHRLDEISRQPSYRSHSGGGLLLPPRMAAELKGHSTALESHSQALTGHVQRMQSLLRLLVRDLESTKEGAKRRALRRKIWLWVARVFRALSIVLSAGGTVLAFVYPIGFLETTAIAGASMFSGAISKLCELAHEKYTDTKLDAILAFLRNSVPESAQAAFLALTSFQACHRVLRLEIEVREGKRHPPWVGTHEAAVAKTDWARAADRLGAVERNSSNGKAFRTR